MTSSTSYNHDFIISIIQDGFLFTDSVYIIIFSHNFQYYIQICSKFKLFSGLGNTMESSESHTYAASIKSSKLDLDNWRSSSGHTWLWLMKKNPHKSLRVLSSQHNIERSTDIKFGKCVYSYEHFYRCLACKQQSM